MATGCARLKFSWDLQSKSAQRAHKALNVHQRGLQFAFRASSGKIERPTVRCAPIRVVASSGRSTPPLENGAQPLRNASQKGRDLEVRTRAERGRSRQSGSGQSRRSGRLFVYLHACSDVGWLTEWTPRPQPPPPWSTVTRCGCKRCASEATRLFRPVANNRANTLSARARRRRSAGPFSERPRGPIIAPDT